MDRTSTLITSPAALDGPQGSSAQEEHLVTDARAGLTPSQMVERKLAGLLKTVPVPVSQLMTGRRLIRSR